jgi:hypothetical protein
MIRAIFFLRKPFGFLFRFTDSFFCNKYADNFIEALADSIFVVTISIPAKHPCNQATQSIKNNPTSPSITTTSQHNNAARPKHLANSTNKQATATPVPKPKSNAVCGQLWKVNQWGAC